MQINLSCLNRFVSKPESNHRTIDPMVEKVHGRGMSQRVWAYVLPLEGTAFFFGDGDVFRQKAFDGIAAELSASDADKERIVGATVAKAESKNNMDNCLGSLVFARRDRVVPGRVYSVPAHSYFFELFV